MRPRSGGSGSSIMTTTSPGTVSAHNRRKTRGQSSRSVSKSLRTKSMSFNADDLSCGDFNCKSTMGSAISLAGLQFPGGPNIASWSKSASALAPSEKEMVLTTRGPRLSLTLAMSLLSPLTSKLSAVLLVQLISNKRWDVPNTPSSFLSQVATCALRSRIRCKRTRLSGVPSFGNAYVKHCSLWSSPNLNIAYIARATGSTTTVISPSPNLGETAAPRQRIRGWLPLKDNQNSPDPCRFML
mmetsp:Transcript_98321/g.300649  ORF Transcript_98321/g.300649 Transcript_98321/m.300649 type:complete len:241 (+) Transcript_98321:1261-1983(+)